MWKSNFPPNLIIGSSTLCSNNCCQALATGNIFYIVFYIAVETFWQTPIVELFWFSNWFLQLFKVIPQSQYQI